MIARRLVFNRLLLLVGSLVLPTVSPAASENENANIPAILRFAEQYNDSARVQPKPAVPSHRSGPSIEPAGTTKANMGKRPPPRREYLQIKDKEIQRQQTEIARLEAQIAALKKPTSTIVETPDFASLRKLAQGVRHALAITPTEQQAQAKILQAQQQWEQDKSALQQQLSKAHADNNTLSAATDRQKNLLVQAKNNASTLREQQQELHVQRQLMQTELDNTIKELANVRAETAALRAKGTVQVTGDMLKATQPREDYAAGVSLGEEILQMQEERYRWGVKSDKQMILAGIADTFTGKRMLADDDLNKILATTEKKVTEAREKISAAQRKKGATYVSEFKKDKRVYQAPSGFWYRIDYAGDIKIPSNASVDVVVKETLVDGTVIQDMEASGVTLSLPIADFPPLFKEAISLLKNHGSMTLVVPPELAYGEKGYPPQVPPNATMIYSLRIAEMYPEPQGENGNAQSSLKKKIE